MVRELSAGLATINELCTRYQVEELHLVGSATAAASIAEVGDLDFLVRFKDAPPARLAENFFGLQESLVTAFGIPVDLVEEETVRNPYLKSAFDERKLRIFRAA